MPGPQVLPPLCRNLHCHGGRGTPLFSKGSSGRGEPERRDAAAARQVAASPPQPRCAGKPLGSAPRRAAVALIRFYQLVLSPLLGSHCRFSPSCSAYAAESISRHGVVRGGWQGLRRLLRCHPLHPGGYDPVT